LWLNAVFHDAACAGAPCLRRFLADRAKPPGLRPLPLPTLEPAAVRAQHALRWLQPKRLDLGTSGVRGSSSGSSSGSGDAMAAFLEVAQARQQQQQQRESESSPRPYVQRLIMCLPEDDDGGDGGDDRGYGEGSGAAAEPPAATVSFGVALADQTLESFGAAQQATFVAATAASLGVELAMVGAPNTRALSL
jgi:hypothetical protein